MDELLENKNEYEEDDDKFDLIHDPELNKNVNVNSEHGRQVIKNYLIAIQEGADSANIVSTKMLYKKTKSDKTDNKVVDKDIMKGGVSENISQRGICPKCRIPVFSNQERIKSAGKYFHEKCFN